MKKDKILVSVGALICALGWIIFCVNGFSVHMSNELENKGVGGIITIASLLLVFLLLILANRLVKNKEAEANAFSISVILIIATYLFWSIGFKLFLGLECFLFDCSFSETFYFWFTVIFYVCLAVAIITLLSVALIRHLNSVRSGKIALKAAVILEIVLFCINLVLSSVISDIPWI